MNRNNTYYWDGISVYSAPLVNPAYIACAMKKLLSWVLLKFFAFAQYGSGPIKASSTLNFAYLFAFFIVLNSYLSRNSL